MPAVLTGNAQNHLCRPEKAVSFGARVHQEIVEPFCSLKREARKAGFDLRIISGYRSFDQQLSIWNRKASGKLAVLDSDAVSLDVDTLSEQELVFAILRWSALPGASRHHWGTDLDVYDAAATPEGYEIELIPEEVNAGGMFGPLHEWLDERIATESSLGFFRPYDADRHGVAPERWHLSYAPIAAVYLEQLTTDVLRAVVQQADILLKDTVLLQLDEIHERFVVNINAFGRVS